MIFLQVAPPPDIQLEVRVEAREVRTVVDGEARLTVRAEPDGGSADETVRTPRNGATVQRNVRVVTRAKARVADPRGEQLVPVTTSDKSELSAPATPAPERR